ncbi:MAG: amidohydrolase family protein [Acidobacteria bacterium]|nr:amidohydrolase family protein [Acidobacteriota bacterium]
MRSRRPLRTTLLTLIAVAAVLATGAYSPIFAQEPITDFRRPPVQTRQFGDMAEGPYNSLVIQNANVLPGHGGPSVGIYDIRIEGNEITQMRRFDPYTPEEEWEHLTGDRVIDARGMYVMPGMINLHLHLRTEPLPLDYVYYLQLATGVTTVGPAPDRGLDEAMTDAGRTARNEMLAPRQYPLWGWGSGLSGYSRAQLEDPAMATEIAEAMVAAGGKQFYLNGLCWNRELFGAAARAIDAAGGITAVHVQPNSLAEVNAVIAAEEGVTMIVHHYGYAESALDRTVPDYPRDYDYFDENERFRQAGKVWEEVGRNPETKKRLLGEIVDRLVKSGVVMQPNRATYEANRNVLAAMGWPWHEKYTHQAMWDMHLPNPRSHAVFHYDWTSDDEYYWSYMYNLWGELIYEFNNRGGTVVFGTDDNYQWSTGGFGNVRELQLMRETGMHALEVLETANWNSAKLLGVGDRLGLVREGYLADLLIVDGNPAENLKYLYPFGDIKKREDHSMYRTRGIVYTIKDGVVVDNAKVMEEVARMVAESKANAAPDIVNTPFLPVPEWMAHPPGEGQGDGGQN